MKLFLIPSLALLIACKSAPRENLAMDKSKIDYVEIRKHFDSTLLRLTDAQLDSLMEKLRTSIRLTPRYVMAKYHLTFYRKDSVRLEYIVSNNVIRGAGGYTYRIDDKEFFKNLWLQQSGLTDKHIEYFPTYSQNGDTFQVVTRLDTAHLKGIKKVLTYYGHKWAEASGYIFYEDSLPLPVLFDYTAKAQDTFWLNNIK